MPKRKLSVPSFETLAREVLALKQMKAAETVAAATRQIARLIENFGPRAITEITPGRWAEYVLREQKKKPRTFYDDKKYMRMILLYAYNEGHLTKRIALPIPDIPSDAGREILQEELDRLFEVAGYTLGFQIEIAVRMGLRLREMLRLRWDQIDLTEGLIFLGARDTKTRKGRIVPIPPCLMAKFLARQPQNTALWVFPSPTTHGPMNNNKTAWRRCKRMAFVIARWHDLRHTCATQMLRKKIELHVVARYLGMSSGVLKRIYTHLSIDDLRVAANRISNDD